MAGDPTCLFWINWLSLMKGGTSVGTNALTLESFAFYTRLIKNVILLNLFAFHGRHICTMLF